MFDPMQWVGEVLCVFSYFNPYRKIHSRFSGEYTSEAFMETLVLSYPLPKFHFEIRCYPDGSLRN
jgi:hypothetical protein